MSLHILSKKSNILHSKTNNSSNLPSTKNYNNFKRFSHCCNNIEADIGSTNKTNSNIFSINDGTHKLRYVGKEYRNRQNKQNTQPRLSHLKHSVVNHSSYLKKRVGSKGNVVSDRFTDKSHADYVHDMKNWINNKNGCSLDYFKYNEISDYEEYVLFLKANCFD